MLLVKHSCLTKSFMKSDDWKEINAKKVVFQPY